MADYHPLILRAVEGLDKNTGENRRALYERARTALVAQLRGVQPALDESEITRERLALEEAIRKVEADAARRAREEPRKPLPPRPAPPRREEPARAAPPPPPPPPPPPVSEPEPPAPEVPEEPRSRLPADNMSLTDQAMRGFRNAMGDPPITPPPPRPQRPEPPATAAPPPRPELPVRRTEPRRQPAEDSWAPPAEFQQPSPPPSFEFSEEPPAPSGRPRRPEQLQEAPAEPRRAPFVFGRGMRIGLIALIGIALGGLVWWQRDTIAGAASSLVAMVGGSGTPTARAPTATPSPPQRPKISDRIGQPQQSGAPAVAQRVVLYEEDPADPQGKRLVGTVVWRTEMMAPAPGRPAEMAVRAEVDVPERQLKMIWSLRRNADKSLPASHTIEIQFNLPADSPTGGVQNVPGVLMKQAEQTRGVPLAGLAVKVTPGFFLIGLSALEADMQRNLALLRERAWFDIPMVYANNRRAILAMEKGTPGERAFNEAFAAWGQ